MPPVKPKHTPQITDAAGKLQPQATELEEMVLGAVMLEKDAYSEVCDLLVPDSFYDPRNQKIFEAICRLGANQRPIDMLTVIEQLRADGTLEEVGGAVAITELTARVTSAAHVEYHARIIAQKYLARRLISFSSKVQNEAFDESNDIDDLLQQAEGELFEISQTQLKREVVQVDSVINQALRMIEAAFVLSMAKNMAMDFSIPLAIFSLEMSNVQLVNRILSNVCEIPGDTIRSGRLSQDEWDRLTTRQNYLFGAPMYIDETPGLSITELRTKARRLVREHGVRMIIIDYLQLMNATGMKFGSREQEVSTISRNLKALAKELNIPIIALSQLNRSTETREDKRPVLSDLRESGAIEQDADFVAFIHRPEYYTRSSEDAEGRDIRGLAEFIVAKHRSGQVGTVKLRFVDKYVRFEDWNKGTTIRTATVQSRMNSEKTAPPPAPDDTDPFNGADSFQGPSDPFAGPMPDIMPAPGESPVPF